MEELAAGDRVLYVPGEEFSRDADFRGRLAWDWARKGSQAPLSDTEAGRLRRNEAGAMVGPSGAECLPLRPRGPWPAVVRAAHADGSADLDIRHFNGCATLHNDRVPYDPHKAPGTYHLEGD